MPGVRRFGVLVLVLAALAGAAGARAQPVDVAIVLAADVSRSIDDEEFRLQREGYAEAFRHPQVIEAIRATRAGAVMVTYVEWAHAGSQRVVIPWMRVGDEDAGELFSATLLREPRTQAGGTSISGAIDFAARLFDLLPAPATRRVIDISGDGVNNSGRPAEQARDDALARGIVINGLVIMNVTPSYYGMRYPYIPLDQYYRDSVIGGPGAFVVAVEDFQSFAFAIVNKLIREISAVPPGTRLAGIDRPGLQVLGAGRGADLARPILRPLPARP